MCVHVSALSLGPLQHMELNVHLHSVCLCVSVSVCRLIRKDVTPQDEYMLILFQNMYNICSVLNMNKILR